MDQDRTSYTGLIKMHFELWLKELDRIAIEEFGYAITPSISDQIGIECWRKLYDDNMTPREALVLDVLNFSYT